MNAKVFLRVSRESIDEICEDFCGDSDSAWWISGQIESAIDCFISSLNDNGIHITIVPTESHVDCECKVVNERVYEWCGDQHDAEEYGRLS